MRITWQTQLGVAALIVFAVVAAVLAAITPSIEKPGDNVVAFIEDLEDASLYRWVNLGFVAVFALSLWGFSTLPELLEDTKGGLLAQLGWLAYAPGGALLIAFIGADAIFIQMMRVAAYEADSTLEQVIARDLTLSYMDAGWIQAMALAATALWLLGLGLLALAIYLADETPYWIDFPIAAGAVVLIVSGFIDQKFVSALGYLLLAVAFAGLGLIIWRARTPVTPAPAPPTPPAT